MTMTSSRPYIVRALYDWILENDCTPYILVNAYGPGVEVPQEHVKKDGQIILNISPGAVKDLDIGNEAIGFSGRFGGIPTSVYVPAAAIMGIYAKENGQGMIFESEDPSPPSPDGDKPVIKSSGSRPPLRIVK